MDHYTSPLDGAKFPREMFSEEVQQVRKNEPPPVGPLSVALNSEETMYSQLRDLNFGGIGAYLSKKAKEISAAFEERHDAKTVQQLKIFVQNLPHMQQNKLSLSKHTTIAELIKQETDKKSFLDVIYAEQGLREEDNNDQADTYIERCLGISEPISKVLRLMCLHSLSTGGLRQKLFERYRSEIIQCYGFHHLVTLRNLERIGLLKIQDGSSRNVPIVRKALKLNVSVVDEQNPKDASYVFSGYAPITVRLVELLDRPNGWQAAEEVLKLIPGPTTIKYQQVGKSQERKKPPTPDQPQIILVFFLGGCSFAEISALRYLASREDSVSDYVIATTNITTGAKIMKSVLSETMLLD